MFAEGTKVRSARELHSNSQPMTHKPTSVFSDEVLDDVPPVVCETLLQFFSLAEEATLQTLPSAEAAAAHLAVIN